MTFSMFEAKYLLRLAIPVFLAQITQILMGVVDTIMAGQVSAVDLASLSIANGIWYPLLLSFQGIVLALTAIIAQYYGAKQIEKIKQSFYQGLYVALLLSVIALGLVQWLDVALSWFKMTPALYQKSLLYIELVQWGLPAVLLFNVCRNLCEGMTLTKPALYISLIGLSVNIPANFIFIYGYFGMPALGGPGCGVATAIVNWCMAGSLLVYVIYNRQFKEIGLFKKIWAPHFKNMLEIVRLGIPLSLATLFEVSLFACIPLFIADLGAIAVSGHQVAASVTTILFMLPYSLAMAICIRVGNLYGKKEFRKLKNMVKTALILAVLISVFVAFITYVGRDAISHIYSDDPEVIALASSILILACFYQLPDALQVAAQGMLRGLKYTRPISWITFFSYWIVGFGLGYLLAKTSNFTDPLGPHGFWLGIICGLTVASILLLSSLYKRFQREPFV